MRNTHSCACSRSEGTSEIIIDFSGLFALLRIKSSNHASYEACSSNEGIGGTSSGSWLSWFLTLNLAHEGDFAWLGGLRLSLIFPSASFPVPEPVDVPSPVTHISPLVRNFTFAKALGFDFLEFCLAFIRPVGKILDTGRSCSVRCLPVEFLAIPGIIGCLTDLNPFFFAVCFEIIPNLSTFVCPIIPDHTVSSGIDILFWHGRSKCSSHSKKNLNSHFYLY